MKKYLNPHIDILTFVSMDIITSSKMKTSDQIPDVDEISDGADFL